MAQKLSKEDEDKLLKAVEEITKEVDKNDEHPTDAAVKVAKRLKLDPGQIEISCTAYNTGRQTAQRKQEKTALSKFATFELADANVVIKRVFKKDKKDIEKKANYTDYWLPDRKKKLLDKYHKIKKNPEVPEPTLKTFEKVAELNLNDLSQTLNVFHVLNDLPGFSRQYKEYEGYQTKESEDLFNKKDIVAKRMSFESVEKKADTTIFGAPLSTVLGIAAPASFLLAGGLAGAHYLAKPEFYRAQDSLEKKILWEEYKKNHNLDPDLTLEEYESGKTKPSQKQGMDKSGGLPELWNTALGVITAINLLSAGSTIANWNRNSFSEIEKKHKENAEKLLNQEKKEAGDRFVEEEKKLNQLTNRLAQYFKQEKRASFADIEAYSYAYIKEPFIKEALDFIHKAYCPKEKRATTKFISRYPLSENDEIIQNIKNLVPQLRSYNRAKEAADRAWYAYYEKVDPEVVGKKQTGFLDLSQFQESYLKKANAPPMVSATFGGAIVNTLDRAFAAPDQKKDLIDDYGLDLEDYQHDKDIRQIKMQSYLAQALNDPDSPLSGYEPAEVLEAYNRIAKLAPEVAIQPAVIEPILKKYLVGQFEPFEAKEILNMEKELTQIKNIGKFNNNQVGSEMRNI